MRRLSAVLVALVCAAVLAGLAPPATAAAVIYVPPVDGRVVDGFRPPATPYGRGNRGLTYETTPGAPVRASAPGRVTFAGQVGGALHVVVQHADGVRTTYAFVRSISVRVGQQVKQSATVATTANSFHFGARIGDAYVDPAILLASGPARVHLVPDGEFSEPGAGDDRAALWSVVRDAFSVTAAAIDWAQNPAGNAASIAMGIAQAPARFAAEHLITMLDTIVNLGQLAGPFAAYAAALADILERFVEACTPPGTPKPVVTERRIAVFVAGVGSKWTPGDHDNLSRRFHAHELYAASQVYDFSYRGGGNKQYGPADTVDDLRKRAADLRVLLDQIARENPGVPVDLIAHSQGGIVAREALAHDYDGPNHRMPPVAHLVTLGTPHHGADSATMGAWLRWTEGGQALLAAGNQVNGFDLNGQSLKQLAEDSTFMRALNDRPLREGVSYTSIAGAKDIVVPGVRARLAGASNVVLDVGHPVESHTQLTHSESARTELARALADQPPTCQPVEVTAANAFMASIVANFEDGLGQMAALGAAAAPVP